GPALQAARGAREEAKVVGHHGDLVVPGGFDRLARVQSLQAGDLAAVLLDQVGHREQRLGTLSRRGGGPAVEGRARSAHGAIHVLGSGNGRAGGLRTARLRGYPLLWGLYSRARLCIAMVIRRLKVDYSRTAPAPAPAVESPSASATAGCMISPSCTFRPARRPALPSSAASIPRSASSITYGSVALERA